jgi:hypothetical protein
MILDHYWRGTLTYPRSIQREFMKMRDSGSRIVLATVPGWTLGYRSGLDPDWNRGNGFYGMKNPNRTEPAVF